MNDISCDQMDKKSEDRISSLKEAFHHASFLSAHSYISSYSGQAYGKGKYPFVYSVG